MYVLDLWGKVFGHGNKYLSVRFVAELLASKASSVTDDEPVYNSMLFDSTYVK